MCDLRRSIWNWVAVGAISVCATLAAGCTTADTEGVQSGSLATVSPETSQDPGVSQVFGRLAAIVAPMPVYGPDRLPPGVSVADTWWPVIEAEEPEAYDGPARSNPLVRSDGGDEPEAQVVLRTETGWLAVLENFRGDLGDVAGKDAGLVAGRPARLYEVNGGVLVQWSDGGLWYGVFGRGVPEDLVLQIALDMRVVVPGAGARTVADQERASIDGAMWKV